MAIFPTAVISFTEKEDKLDIVKADHINDIQDEIEILEAIMGTNPQGSLTSLNDRLNIMMNTNGAFAQGSAFPTGVEGQPFYRTDLNTFYIHDGSDFTALSSHGIAVFTSNGTWTVPGGITTAYISEVGAGGGGGGTTLAGANGGGGGGGGEGITNFPLIVTPAAELAVIIGTGGLGGVGDLDGSVGGSTSLGDLIVLGGAGGLCGSNGGLGGVGGGGKDGGDSGSGSAGASGAAGEKGGDGGSGAGNGFGGAGGGGSIMGTGAPGVGSSSNGNPGADNSGGGGSGAGDTAGSQTGGKGGSGMLVIIY